MNSDLQLDGMDVIVCIKTFPKVEKLTRAVLNWYAAGKAQRSAAVSLQKDRPTKKWSEQYRPLVYKSMFPAKLTEGHDSGTYCHL